MAALLEGQQYGLSAQDKINSNKSLVFVKLTDSALRSIEEFVKRKGDTVSRPTIEFQNSNGVIRLPQNGSNQSYGFTLSNVEADGPQGSFECLRQSGNRSLESLGCMHMKMHIHATEDSYEKTRVKMAAAEQEHKKFCTKEIKPSGAHLGRKVKVKRPGLVVSPIKSSPPMPSMLTKNPVKIQNSFSVSSSSLPSIKKPEPQKFPKVAPKTKLPQEHLRIPIRDRLIHILAIRPYKRPELLLRLMTEGVREKDRKGISAILSQVATLKGNVYVLANYLWNEVQDNYKFCTQEEAEIIRKRKQQFLNSNSENGSSSPNTIPYSMKRVAGGSSVSTKEPRIKKQRISHYVRPDNATPNTSNGSPDYSASFVNSDSVKTQSPPLSHPRPSDLASESKVQVSPDSKTHFQDKRDTCSKTVVNGSNGYVNRNGIKNNFNNQPPYTNLTKVTSTTNGSCSNSPHSSSDSRDSMDYNSSDLQVPPPTASPSQFDCPEYLKEYGTIETRNQRARYKADFNSQYEEYLRLHSQINNISRTFAGLERHLHTCEEGSDEFRKIKGKIYKAYRAYQQDPNYIDSLKKFNFLHGKLSHIKRLVMEFDNLQCVRS